MSLKPYHLYRVEYLYELGPIVYQQLCFSIPDFYLVPSFLAFWDFRLPTRRVSKVIQIGLDTRLVVSNFQQIEILKEFTHLADPILFLLKQNLTHSDWRIRQSIGKILETYQCY